MAWWVRLLVQMAKDEPTPSTSRVEAIRKLSELRAHAATSLRAFAVE